MFVLTESPHSAFLHHLQERLQGHGIQCLVSEIGPRVDGEVQFAIQLPLYSQMVDARRLLYRSRHFANSIDPRFDDAFSELRAQPHHQLMDCLTSPWALRISMLCVAILLAGLAVEAMAL
ncbi:hypothetical protein ACX0MV_01185 [Pseudomonas borbori]